MSDFNKDPDAKLDYGVDWSDWLQDGESISTSNWAVERQDGASVESGGLSILQSPSPSTDGEQTTVWVEGGQVGVTYELVNSIDTDAQREDDRTIGIYVTQR
jgi:hypothetical protein